MTAGVSSSPPSSADSFVAFRVDIRLVTVTTASVATMTTSESQVGISGIAGFTSSCRYSRISLTPMKARMNASP